MNNSQRSRLQDRASILNVLGALRNENKISDVDFKAAQDAGRISGKPLFTRKSPGSTVTANTTYELVDTSISTEGSITNIINGKVQVGHLVLVEAIKLEWVINTTNTPGTGNYACTKTSIDEEFLNAKIQIWKNESALVFEGFVRDMIPNGTPQSPDDYFYWLKQPIVFTGMSGQQDQVAVKLITGTTVGAAFGSGTNFPTLEVGCYGAYIQK